MSLVLFLLLIIWLQMYLSKSESTWPGLMLPFISFLFSIFFVMGLVVFPEQTRWQIFLQTSSTFLLLNAPTLILLTIYAAARKRQTI